MTQLSAICFSYLKGETNSIMTAFKKFNCTNLPRENGRAVERKFGVKLKKIPKKFVSVYGHTGEYFSYNLPRTNDNKPGIKRMKDYVLEQLNNPKTNQEKNIKHQLRFL
jgi:hypothetical protein